MPSIYQLLPTVSYGDAVSNDALAMSDAITEMGYDNKIFAHNIDPKVKNRVYSAQEFMPDAKDIIIFHMSIGSELSDRIKQLSNRRKIMIYHNITPEHYFFKYSSAAYNLCRNGREQLTLLKDVFTMSISDSNYNKLELKQLGYKKNKVLPIIINFDDYRVEPDISILNNYDDDYVNIVFVGRIAPNKKHEDIIKSFYLYKKYINSRSRLILVGSANGMDRYLQSLNHLIHELNLKDVIIPGHISFREIIGYYKIASVFLCMSEHEGFCVPLLESMFFKVPIIAYESSAVPETLGNSGIIVKEKKYEVVAELIDLLVKNKELRNKIINAQSRRLSDFDREKIKKQFKQYLSEVL